jgi:hypothetical protein
LGVRIDNEFLARESSETSLDNKITALEDNKFNKAGGSLSGEVTLDSYLNFGTNWRVKASADGSKIIFQHKKADGVWRNAIPFIASV